MSLRIVAEIFKYASVFPNICLSLGYVGNNFCLIKANATYAVHFLA